MTKLELPDSIETSEQRRQFLKLSSLFTAMGALPLLNTYSQAIAAEPNAPVKIGYLAVTDSTPLLVAHHNKLFEAQGIEVEKPRMFRSWAQLVEAFLSGQVNVVHLLSPMTVWARYGSQSRAKVVAWNHMAGSGLTVLPTIDKLTDLGGKTVAIPFWYSIHNIVLQHILKSQGIESISEGEPNDKQVKLVVMAPSDMADVWKDHACCVVLMHENDLEKRPEWSQKVVSAIVQAQAWIQDHRDETAHILAKDNAQHYTPHAYDTLAQVLAPAASQAAKYKASGAITHPAWKEKRIDFQPYPFPSYTEELIKMLKTTTVSGNNAFLKTLNPSFVAHDLVDDRFVKKAIADLGGMSAFGLPETYTRKEIITV